MVNWFKNQGRWHSYTYTPKAGDLVFYNWSSSSGGAQHVGVVTGVSGKRVYTKEGNTYNGIVSSFSNRTAGVSKQGNGWAYIIGYASPNYVTPPPPISKPPTPVYTGTVTTIPDGVYTIRSAANTAFTIDLQDGSSSNGTQIQIWRYYKPAAANQKFRFTKYDDGTYKITNEKTGKAVDVYNGGKFNHTNVQQWEVNNSAAQRWYVEINTDGSYSFRSKTNNLYMDIYGGTIANGSKITTYVGNYSAAQKFQLWNGDVDNQVEGDILSLSGLNSSYVQTGSAITPVPTVQRIIYQKSTLRAPANGAASSQYDWIETCWITKGKTYTVEVGGLQRLAGGHVQASMLVYDFGAAKASDEKRLNISPNKQAITFTASQSGELLFYAGIFGSCKGCATQWNNIMVRETLIPNTDYTLSYANNVNPGTATVTASLTGSSKKSKSTSFKIAAAANSTPTPTPTPSKPAPTPTPTPKPTPDSVKSQAMYRLYNPNSGEHFYTASTEERDHLISLTWGDEGQGWTAPTSGDAVFRLYNPYAGEHHYTTSEEERDMLISVGWNYEGIGWYTSGDTPVYRVYNPNAYANNHHYTTDAGERDILLSYGWQDEGVGWYGVG